MTHEFRSFAIVPAAGRSKRMGRDKLLLPWGEATVIEAVVRAWREGGVDHVVVVTRADQQALSELCQSAGATVVMPATAPPEMRDSVCCGLAHIREAYSPCAEDVWLLAPADMPRLSPRVIERLLEAHDRAAPAILAPIAAGKRGHPVLFPWPLADAASALAADEGVNALLERHPVREIHCDRESLHDDLDTPDDYERLSDSSNGKP